MEVAIFEITRRISDELLHEIKKEIADGMKTGSVVIDSGIVKFVGKVNTNDNVLIKGNNA